jgi:hypothetical protein
MTEKPCQACIKSNQKSQVLLYKFSNCDALKSIEKPCLYTWERITSRQAVLILDETQIHEGEIQKERRVLKKNSVLV